MTPPPHFEQTGSLIQRAQTLLDLGRPEEAVSVLLQALARSPGNAQVSGLLSLAHGSTGNYQEALRWANETVSNAPDNEWGHRLRAVHLLNLNAPRDALRAAEEAVRLEPEMPAALQTLVRALLRQNRMQDAEMIAERLRVLAPESYLSHETLGLVAIRRQQWQTAAGHCRRALALRPNSYYALNNLGVALSHMADPVRPSVQGQYLEAMECLYQAVQLNPTERLAHENLTRTMDRYLLSQQLFSLFFVTLGLSAHIGGTALPFCWLAVSLVAGAMLIVRNRRRRALPPALQDHWRRTGRLRRFGHRFWGAAIRPTYGRKKR